MSHLPLYLPLLFISITALTLFLFYRAGKPNKIFLAITGLWMLLQSVLALNGFFTVSTALPPRITLVVLPPLIAVVLMLTTRKGKTFADSLDTKQLTLLHSVRIVIEMILFWLFVHKAMPELMTFEGRNMDMISGLSAPLVYYFGYVRKKLSNGFLLAWNFACLIILAFTVTNAILSMPTPFQQYAFDQPTRAVLYFPFIWLPGVVVPLVYASHLVTIRQLLLQRKSATSTGWQPQARVSGV